MKREELTIKSNFDQLELGVSIRIPEHPKGILQLVHGMAEHRERYHDFMDYCVEHGLVVIIHDHRGHGASVKAKEDLGYFGKDGEKAIVEDVHQITNYIKERFPDLPLTLFGHSMGSLVVRCYIQKYDQDIDGLIVCGSPSYQVGSKVGLVVAKLMQVFKNEKHRSNLINTLAFSKNSKRFKHEGNPNAWVVSDKAVLAAYDADERDGFVFTLNGFEALFKLMQRAYNKKGWLVKNPDLPVLFIAGADDPCILDAKHFQKAVDFLRQRGYHDVTSKLYPGMRHEILNEVGKLQVWQDVLEQIKKSGKLGA